MQHFYDAQIRRYITQTIRVFSNFVVKYSDGSLVRIPVTYGDPDRQVANIIKQNSENAINACPRIAVYVENLELDRDRLSDSTYVGKIHIRERDMVDDMYTSGQGKNYTVERLMPTPFKLTLKVDIWSANTDQKLQILEQILVLFNPALELQTTDNYIDWTSLSVLHLDRVQWTSRQVPVGTDSPYIDISTLSLTTPIWISPPVKVKHLGVITKIITSLYNSAETIENAYIDGLGHPQVSNDVSLVGELSKQYTTISDYKIQVYNGQAILLGKSESSVPREPSLDIPARQGTPLNWLDLFDRYPGKYIAGSSSLYLLQSNGTEVIGTVAVNPVDSTILSVSWDQDTLNTNTGIDSQGRYDYDPLYDLSSCNRPNSPGTFDAIIDPLKVGPDHGISNLAAGDRFLIIDDIGSIENQNGAIAWKNIDNSDFVATANDIVEWTGTEWIVIFNAVNVLDTIVYQTNIFTGVQYTWNGVLWSKSFEGEYSNGFWRLEL